MTQRSTELLIERLERFSIADCPAVSDDQYGIGKSYGWQLAQEFVSEILYLYNHEERYMNHGGE